MLDVDQRIQELTRWVHAGDHARAASLLNTPGYVDDELRTELDIHELLSPACRYNLHLVIDALREQQFLPADFFAVSETMDDFRDYSLLTGDGEPVRALVQWNAGSPQNDTESVEEAIRLAPQRLDAAAQDLYVNAPQMSDAQLSAGWVVIARALLNAAQAIDARPAMARTAASSILYHAVSHRHRADTIDLLMRQGADLDYSNDPGKKFTCYTRALIFGQEENAKVMLRYATPTNLKGLRTGLTNDDLVEVHQRLLRERRDEVAAAAAPAVQTRRRARPKGL